MKPKNWSKFQHFKDRRPPWIKLYRDILDDLNWYELSPKACKHLVSIWLISSEYDGNIPTKEILAFRLRATAREVEASLSELIEKEFIVDIDEEFIDTPVSPKDIAKKNGFGTRYISDSLKQQVFKRDKGVCKSCGSTQKIEYDHIKPVSKGGESTLNNLQLLCRSCNRKKRGNYSKLVAGNTLHQAQNLRSLETETETETETDNTSTSVDSSFNSFWNKYPKKVGKAEAMKCWKRLKPNLQSVLQSLDWQIKSDQWIKGFIPNPSTYLNQGRWDDEPPQTGVKAPRRSWFDTEDATMEKGTELGLQMYNGEDLGHFRERIQKKISRSIYGNR